MTTVSISELKAGLSRYLHEVRRGGEVQVLDRGKPVARLVAPAVEDDDDDLRARLVSAGVIRPGQGGVARIERPPLALRLDLSEALAEDRADRL
jgi:prevent-host-death family protein